jgi:hypothetical protein
LRNEPDVQVMLEYKVCLGGKLDQCDMSMPLPDRRGPLSAENAHALMQPVLTQ